MINLSHWDQKRITNLSWSPLFDDIHDITSIVYNQRQPKPWCMIAYVANHPHWHWENESDIEWHTIIHGSHPVIIKTTSNILPSLLTTVRLHYIFTSHPVQHRCKRVCVQHRSRRMATSILAINLSARSILPLIAFVTCCVVEWWLWPLRKYITLDLAMTNNSVSCRLVSLNKCTPANEGTCLHNKSHFSPKSPRILPTRPNEKSKSNGCFNQIQSSLELISIYKTW